MPLLRNEIVRKGRGRRKLKDGRLFQAEIQNRRKEEKAEGNDEEDENSKLKDYLMPSLTPYDIIAETKSQGRKGRRE